MRSTDPAMGIRKYSMLAKSKTMVGARRVDHYGGGVAAGHAESQV